MREGAREGGRDKTNRLKEWEGQSGRQDRKIERKREQRSRNSKQVYPPPLRPPSPSPVPAPCPRPVSPLRPLTRRGRSRTRRGKWRWKACSETWLRSCRRSASTRPPTALTRCVYICRRLHLNPLRTSAPVLGTPHSNSEQKNPRTSVPVLGTIHSNSEKKNPKSSVPVSGQSTQNSE